MEYAGVAGFLVEEESKHGEVEHGQPEIHGGEVFVFLQIENCYGYINKQVQTVYKQN